jgi:hypothetical protein
MEWKNVFTNLCFLRVFFSSQRHSHEQIFNIYLLHQFIYIICFQLNFNLIGLTGILEFELNVESKFNSIELNQFEWN